MFVFQDKVRITAGKSLLDLFFDELDDPWLHGTLPYHQTQLSGQLAETMELRLSTDINLLGIRDRLRHNEQE